MEIRPDLRAALAACLADEPIFGVGETHIIGSALTAIEIIVPLRSARAYPQGG